MDFKKFWKETFAGFVLKNILAAAGIVIVLAWIALFGVDYYTNHGETQVVPELRGLYLEEAQVLLAKQGLHPQVIDSVYVRDKQLGTIIDQIPGSNSSVKANRAIYIIINSRQVRQVSLPEIADVSYRQADAMLKAIGLSVSNIEYTPSEYKDLVSEIKYRGRSILPGTRIPEGSSVVLVVGSGLGDNAMIVPALMELKLEQAQQALLADSLVIGAIDYDVPPTNANKNAYFVYRQSPEEGESLPAGSRVDIWLTRDKARLTETVEPDKQSSPSKGEDEVFF